MMASRGLRRGVAGSAASVFCVSRATAAAALTPRRFAVDAALSGALQRELSEELSRSGKPEQPVPPPGWSLQRTAGKCTFRMIKKYEDEEITIYYNPKEDRGDVDNHEIIVMITRENTALQIDISIEEGELVLDNICFYKDASLAKDETAEGDTKRMELYPGPKVSELDDALLDSFVKYLEKRGVDEQLGEFITLYSFWTEQQEYENWLDSIGKFVS